MIFDFSNLIVILINDFMFLFNFMWFVGWVIWFSYCWFIVYEWKFFIYCPHWGYKSIIEFISGIFFFLYVSMFGFILWYVCIHMYSFHMDGYMIIIQTYICYHQWHNDTIYNIFYKHIGTGRSCIGDLMWQFQLKFLCWWFKEIEKLCQLTLLYG